MLKEGLKILLLGFIVLQFAAGARSKFKIASILSCLFLLEIIINFDNQVHLKVSPVIALPVEKLNVFIYIYFLLFAISQII